jgi:hypothetical protein
MSSLMQDPLDGQEATEWTRAAYSAEPRQRYHGIARSLYPRAIRSFPYFAETGRLIGLHVRLAVPPGTNDKFRWCGYDREGQLARRWIRSPGVEALYCYWRAASELDRHASPRVVWITEGERDCDSLWGLGQIAVSHPAGAVEPERAVKWADEDTAWVWWLRPDEVRVVADNDKPGLWTAEQVARKLEAANLKVKRLVPPGE